MQDVRARLASLSGGIGQPAATVCIVPNQTQPGLGWARNSNSSSGQKINMQNEWARSPPPGSCCWKDNASYSNEAQTEMRCNVQLPDWLPKPDSASEAFFLRGFFYGRVIGEPSAWLAASNRFPPLQPVLFVAFGPGWCC